MKLTPEQIQQLYKFTRQHYVEHYDMQTELVDHLANDIEQIWQEKPTLSFEDARTISFKKFGVCGFMDVVAERQKALSKKYWKIIWSFAKNWFELPKIILTTFIFIVFLVICKTIYAKYILLAVLLILCLYVFYKSYFLNKTFKNNFKKNGKKWMLEEMIFKTGMGSFLALPINFFNILNLTHIDKALILSNWIVLLYALIFTFLIIAFYVVIEVLPKKAEELLIEQYPEYKLV